MPRYDNPKKVADFLSTLSMEVTGTQTGTFSPDHTRYQLKLARYGRNVFYTSFEHNPMVYGNPDIPEVFGALLSDASMAEDCSAYEFLDEYADGMKPSSALRAYESCKKTLDWMRDELYLSRSEIAEMGEMLDSDLDEVREMLDKSVSEREMRRAQEHPKAPEGFIAVEELQKNLDLGDYGDQVDYFDGDLDYILDECADGAVDIYESDLIKWLPGNEGWLEDAEANGHLEGTHGDIYKMIQAAQYEAISADLSEHRESICTYGTLDVLKDEGLYAMDSRLADDILNGDVDFDVDCVPTDDVKEAIFHNVFAHLDERYGDEVAETLSDAMRDADKPFDYVNPYALSRDAVRSVNELGFDAAFQKSFAPVLEENGLSLDAVTIDRESRDMSAGKDALTENASHEKDEPETEKPLATDNNEHEG